MLGRADGVDGAECQAEQAIIVGVLSEGRRDGSGRLDGLRGSSHSADHDLVSIDVTAGARAVTVGDIPGLTVELLARGGRVVLGVACGLAAWSLSGEYPAVIVLASE